MFYPVGCGCPAKQSVLMSSSSSFTRLYVGTVDFVSRPLVLRHSDKRRVLAELKVIFELSKSFLQVEYYGTPVNLKSIAQISTPDATSLLIQPYDKSSLKLIEKTIVAANLGVSTSNDGEVIRATVPPLTSDRRKELAKTVAKLAEDGKVAIRNIRRDAIKAYDKLQKEKKLSEDNVKDLSADLQKVTDEYMKKIETLQKQKEEVLLSIFLPFLQYKISYLLIPCVLLSER
ncbi:hypothetical protein PR202_gb21317 [Eleusine coracana subsp. coracana]|uniref:Ribosome-recycling factor, chloroplastic n=1 Tax=Eleusine coracana subsp. coracana TaxID=191504 RepID=A0AAV5FAV6_ELECO|nr:hypothetical protein PR202_gb21317 [Eleusine coracana subsp. coracana]